MWDFLLTWSFLFLCVAAPAVAWVTIRGQAARKADAARNLPEQEYAAARKREISNLLASKLPRKTLITRPGVRFEAVYLPAHDAVWVSNLGASPHLPVEVFSVAAELLATHGRALKGDAMSAKLGEPSLPLDSIEGAIANRVFGRIEGDVVFRRITPIAGLLAHLRLAEYDGRSDFLEAPGMRVAAATDASPAEPAEVLHSAP